MGDSNMASKSPKLDIQVINNSTVKRATSWEEYANMKGLQLLDRYSGDNFDIVLFYGDKNRIVIAKGKESNNRLWVKSLIAFDEIEIAKLTEMLNKINEKIAEVRARELVKEIESNPALMKALKKLLGK